MLAAAERNRVGAIAHTGGWINAMLQELGKSKEVSSIHVVGVHRGKRVEQFTEGKITQVLIPSVDGAFNYDPRLGKRLRLVVEHVQPDVIDVQGIEFFLVRSLLSQALNFPTVLTIQGLTSECLPNYNGGVDILSILKHLTLRNFLRPDGLFSGRRTYRRRGKNETIALQQSSFVLGRTEWDKVHVLDVNPELKYFHCDRILRDAFYRNRWDLDAVERFSVFTTQGRTPLKGLHVLLRAIEVLRREFPGIRLYVGGKDLANKKGLFNRLSFTDYQNYVGTLLDRYRVRECVSFTGFISAEEVARRLCGAHVFALPSFLDNSPNALAEAQILGVPSVASLVGGVGSYVTESHSGLLYNCTEPLMLASQIRRIFRNDGLARTLSLNSRKIALRRHDRQRNAHVLIRAYSDVIRLHHAS